MAYTVTPTFRALADQINKEPIIAVQIQDSKYIYGTAPIKETARWDDPRIKWDNDIGVTWDGEIEREDSKPYIIIKGGQTTKRLAQQLLVDKGGSGSISNFTVDLVDYKGEVAEDLSFNQIGDPLSKKATVYVSLKGSRFPQDFIPILKGNVDDIEYNAGSIAVSIALNTNLARQSSYELYQGVLSGTIDNVTTTISADTVNPFLDSQDIVTSYIRIGDEIMEVVSRDEVANTFTVVRERLGTIATSHEDESEITSYYTINESPIELILKLLHSNEGNTFTDTGYNVSALLRVSSTETVERAIIVDYFDIQGKLGFVPGDKILLSGTASNDGEYTVQSFATLDTGKSYIVVEEETLTEETGLTVNLQIKSQYNTLPDGCGLDIEFIDTAAFQEVNDLFSSAFVPFSFKLDETISDTREFIIKEICRPMGLYLISRKARTSIKFTAPPFSATEIPVLNTENCYDLVKTKLKRSTHKYLLNRVIYRYNTGTLETGKFFNKLIKINADSLSRIKAGRKDQVIEAKGLPRSSAVLQTLQRIGDRILNRYKFGSLYVQNVKVLFSTAATIEIGDIVFFGGEDTQLVNLESGERNLPLEQYEVIDRQLDLIKGEVSLKLLQTSFGIDGIFATYSAASRVAAGSTTTKVLIESFWGSDQFLTEREKWEKWVGLQITVRSDDFTFEETVTIDALDPVTDNGLIITPALSIAPNEGYWIEAATFDNYKGSEEDIDRAIKLSHTFVMPSSLLTGVTSPSIFTVDAGEIGKYEVGMEVQVHSEDFTIDSETRIIDDITSNTITLNEDLDITPAIGHRLEVYAFADEKGYRII